MTAPPWQRYHGGAVIITLVQKIHVVLTCNKNILVSDNSFYKRQQITFRTLCHSYRNTCAILLYCRGMLLSYPVLFLPVIYIQTCR